MMMDQQKQKNLINVLYIFLIVSTILSFVPEGTAQMASLAMITVVLLACYFYRRKQGDDSLLNNHLTYMIGTIWIGSAVLVIGMFVFGIWVYLQGDHSIIYNAVDGFQNGQSFDEAAMRQIMMDYMTANQPFLILSSLPTIGPAILYIVYRVANGYGRAMKGYRIAKPKGWM